MKLTESRDSDQSIIFNTTIKMTSIIDYVNKQNESRSKFENSAIGAVLRQQKAAQSMFENTGIGRIIDQQKKLRAIIPDSVRELSRIREDILPTSFLEAVIQTRTVAVPLQKILDSISPVNTGLVEMTMINQAALLKNQFKDVASLSSFSAMESSRKLYESSPFTSLFSEKISSFSSTQSLEWESFEKVFEKLPQEQVEAIEDVVQESKEGTLTLGKFTNFLKGIFEYCKENNVKHTVIQHILLYVIVNPLVLDPVKESLGFTKSEQVIQQVTNNYYSVYNEITLQENLKAIRKTALRTNPRINARCMFEIDCGMEVWIEKKNRKWMMIGFYDDNNDVKSGWVLIKDFEDVPAE